MQLFLVEVLINHIRLFQHTALIVTQSSYREVSMLSDMLGLIGSIVQCVYSKPYIIKKGQTEKQQGIHVGIFCKVFLPLEIFKSRKFISKVKILWVLKTQYQLGLLYGKSDMKNFIAHTTYHDPYHTTVLHDGI